MLGELRDSNGRPNARARLIAAIIVIGMVLLSAPTVLIPMLRALWNFLLF